MLSAFTFDRYTTSGDFALATTTDMKSGITTAIAYGNDVNHYKVPILEETICLLKMRPLVNHPLALPLPLLQRVLFQAEDYLHDVRGAVDSISSALQVVDHEMVTWLQSRGEKIASDAAALTSMNKKIVSSTYYLTYTIFRHSELFIDVINELMARAETSNITRKDTRKDSQPWIEAQELHWNLQNAAAQIKEDRENLNRRVQMLATTASIIWGFFGF